MTHSISTGDTKRLKNIIQKIIENRQTLIDGIQNSNISDKEKRKIITDIESLNQIQPKINEKLKEFGYDISKDLIASIMATIMLDLLVPIILPAVSHGPIIVSTVLEFIKNCFI